jgi:hypothetical protein
MTSIAAIKELCSLRNEHSMQFLSSSFHQTAQFQVLAEILNDNFSHLLYRLLFALCGSCCCDESLESLPSISLTSSLESQRCFRWL